MARRRSRKHSNTYTVPDLVALGVLTLAVLWAASAPLAQRAQSHVAALVALLSLALAGGVGVAAWRRWRRRERLMARVRTLNDLLLLTPAQFEYAVMELLRAWGYRDVRHTGGAGDLTADLTCRTPDGRSLVVVQCKRYAPGHKVSSPAVQTFIGMLAVRHRAHQGIFVTTSSYTQPALALGQRLNLRMIDGAQLATYIRQRQQRSAYSPEIALVGEGGHRVAPTTDTASIDSVWRRGLALRRGVSLRRR